MIHLKNSGYLPQDAKKLLSEADKLVAGMHAIVRDTRVSSRYLEFDISVSKEHLDLLVKKLETIGPLDNARHIIEEEMEKEEAIEKGRDYFNDERFWECHETLRSMEENIRRRKGSNPRDNPCGSSLCSLSEKRERDLSFNIEAWNRKDW